MVRSAAALAAVLILPTFALGQEPQGTHTVVRDDTLWDLAIRYYDSPWEWRVIWDANRDVVEDPHWIYPAEVLVIPGLPGEAQPAREPAQEPTEEPVDRPETGAVPEDLVPFGLRPPRPVAEGAHTVFYSDPAEARARVEAARVVEYSAVPADRVYSAPWLMRLERQPASDGVVLGFAGRAERAETMMMYSEIRIEMPTPARIGERLQLFRVSRTIPAVGQVVRPTGVATVSVIGEGEVVAVVDRVYHRIQAGDLVRALPAYSPRPGVYAEPVSGGSEAMIMGFAGRQVITDIGHVAFLDLGSDDGIAIGDEFILYGDAIPNQEEGALQVIYTTPTTASARVLSMADNVWQQGVVVRLARTMR